jgi:hypothetical protein
VFACLDHYTAEAWAHVAKIGDRFAALQPTCDAVTDRFGGLDGEIAAVWTSARLGTPIPLGPLHRLAGLARDR